MQRYLFGAGLAIVGLVAFWLYSAGYSAAEQKHQKRELAQIEAARVLDAHRLKLAQERDDLVRQLEGQAHADPVIVDRCLGPDRVLRLNSLR